jgi:hypothetical protein
MTKGIAFVERGIERYQQKFKEQQLHLLQKKAESLVLQLVPV